MDKNKKDMKSGDKTTMPLTGSNGKGMTKDPKLTGGKADADKHGTGKADAKKTPGLVLK
jgi:hypothetical protein